MNQPCPFCGAMPKLQDSIVIYKTRSYGAVWTCGNYPNCDAYVGCHNGTSKPLGTLANAELRRIRNIGHATFDRIWKQKIMHRTKAYAWLSKEMGIPVAKTHFAMFDKPTALRAIEIADEFYNRNKPKDKTNRQLGLDI